MLEALLSNLNGVRKTGRDSFVACCPAHNDKSPSLAIRETEDGTILLHCFAGCSVNEICDAAGLEISELFPPKQSHAPSERHPFSASDALDAIAFEALVVVAAASSMLAEERLAAADHLRLQLALGRITSARSTVFPQIRRRRYG